MEDLVGKQLGNYRLLRMLGQGGFADVYLAQHQYLNTQVAIKVAHSRLASNELQRFLTEARTIAALIHPYIVRVLDFGVEGDVPFLVMDYAPYGTLRQRYPGGARVPLGEFMPYVEQSAAALQYAHNRHLIHRDVKPENMLLNPNNEVLLSDFGIALLTQTSHYQTTQDILGTVAYMAPEQLQGKPQPASDQYALGIVVYEWLSGARPFHGSFTEIATQHVLATPAPLYRRIPGVTPDIEWVVMKALAKEPQDRFRNMQAFATALEQAYQSLEAPQSAQVVSRLSEANIQTYVTPHQGYEAQQPVVMDAPSRQYQQGQTTSVPQEGFQAARGGLSRRALLGGLAGVGVLAIGGGISWLALSGQFTPKKPVLLTPGPSPTADPTVLPAGVIYIYRNHSLDVYAAAWSPDGQRAASASADTTVQIWDAATGAHPLIYRGHSDEVNAVAWSPQTNLIASGSKDKTVRVWDPASGNTSFVYLGHSLPVRSVAWAPNGPLIVSAGDDKTAQVWDARTGKTITTYSGHSDVIWAVAWSPDGKSVASASEDRTVQVWDAMSGKLLFTYQGHALGVLGVTWSPDGKSIASGSRDSTTQVWNAPSGNTLFTYRGQLGHIWSVGWSPDGRRMASAGSDTTVQLWDALTGNNAFIYTHHTKTVWAALWSPDGKRLLSASSDFTAQVWQAM